ncbi:MAG: ABC transporter ATP-binding protein [Candidatus Roizmanbacteria bacterium]|nr:ABC transporter ATP-binding protein [Candidatus Roizmanbacteria bacterium]
MSKPAIEVKNISKSYVVSHTYEGYETLRDILGKFFTHPFRTSWMYVRQVLAHQEKEHFWALRDVSFSVEKGEIFGVIGANGAGKSTLLKVLNRITPPTEGEAILRGSLSSLLEVGTGFHPELTGRENVFFSGAIMGMRRQEIIRKFNDIVAFADIGRFLDTPVKRYSSGMQVRLAFSVAAHMEPDILLVDEVLAVGDASFQRRCLEKIREVSARDKRTILFVSHNLSAVTSLCTRCLYLKGGRVRMIGPTAEVVAAYLEDQSNTHSYATLTFPRPSSIKPSFRSIEIHNDAGMVTNEIDAGHPFSVTVEYQTVTENAPCWVSMTCSHEDGTTIYSSADVDKYSNSDFLTKREVGVYRSTFTFPASSSLSLNEGGYQLHFRLTHDPSTETVLAIHIKNDARRFNLYPGTLLVGGSWSVAYLGVE